MIKVAINGFGRIGRTFLRTVLDSENIQVVAINDLAPTHVMAHLLKYDSIHGTLNNNVSHTQDSIIVDDNTISFTHHKNLEDLNWDNICLLYTSPSPRDQRGSRMPSSA